MRETRIVVVVLALISVCWLGFTPTVEAQPVAAVPPPPTAAPARDESGGSTPPRMSYVNGEVSFWRQGASDWTPAQLNIPLAPGDVLYTSEGGAVEIQIGRAAFVRAGNDTQIGLDNQENDFLQFRVTGGHAGIDLRQVPPGGTVEIDTPQAAFTIQQAGYYRLDVDQNSTTFSTQRGGAATMTPAGGAAAPIAPNQQVVLTGTDSPTVALGAAPPLNAWDNWNYQRSAYLLRSASQRYVSPAMYGGEELDQNGTWRNAETYGPVWVPSAVPSGWQPYSTGRWVWDPRFGWTWLDDAPWGWAPYHYGRWVFVGNYWAWAPGPVVVRPVYAPALVVFLGGPTVGVGVRPLCWAPLGWGEPVVPWWGRPGFVGVPWWGGWGGPRVVNNVVINRTTVVNVTNINVYKNVNITHAVVGVPADRFGRGQVQVTRISQTELQQLRPMHGALDVKPVAASLAPATGPAAKPPAELRNRPVVATRAPEDHAPTLREHGLTESETRPTARLVPAPKKMTPQEGVGGPTSPGARPPARLPSTASRGPDQGPGGAKSEALPPTGRKGRGQEMPTAEGNQSGSPDRPMRPSGTPPAAAGPSGETPGQQQKQAQGERPTPHGGAHAQARANRPGPPPKAEHPRHREQQSRPAQAENPEKAKDR
ncbi:MAG TPA: DUF6600 domain-containing protein [Candidatus Methylomirabilis sp.]|nr:DUF6600 domain-containing protein [Candidatus Methylomirabilis sp.]